MVEEVQRLQRRAQRVRCGGVGDEAREVGHDDAEAAEAAHHPEGVLVGHVIADVDREDGQLARALDPVLDQPLDGLALVPLCRRPELVHHLAVRAPQHRHLRHDPLDRLVDCLALLLRHLFTAQV